MIQHCLKSQPWDDPPNIITIITEDDDGNVIDQWATSVAFTVAEPEMFRHRLGVPLMAGHA